MTSPVGPPFLLLRWRLGPAILSEAGSRHRLIADPSSGFSTCYWSNAARYGTSGDAASPLLSHGPQARYARGHHGHPGAHLRALRARNLSLTLTCRRRRCAARPEFPQRATSGVERCGQKRRTSRILHRIRSGLCGQALASLSAYALLVATGSKGEPSLPFSPWRESRSTTSPQMGFGRLPPSFSRLTRPGPRDPNAAR